MDTLTQFEYRVLPLAALLALALATGPILAGDTKTTPHAPDVQYTLSAEMINDHMAFVGVGGDIDGVVNPELRAEPGHLVEIVFVDRTGAEHDFTLPGLEVETRTPTRLKSGEYMTFRATRSGVFEYTCVNPDHRQAGMRGAFVVGPGVTWLE